MVQERQPHLDRVGHRVAIFDPQVQRQRGARQRVGQHAAQADRPALPRRDEMAGKVRLQPVARRRTCRVLLLGERAIACRRSERALRHLTQSPAKAVLRAAAVGPGMGDDLAPGAQRVAGAYQLAPVIGEVAAVAAEHFVGSLSVEDHLDAVARRQAHQVIADQRGHRMHGLVLEGQYAGQ